jgi:hypothetical protein
LRWGQVRGAGRGFLAASVRPPVFNTNFQGEKKCSTWVTVS